MIAGAGGPMHADGASVAGFVLPVEVPQSKREHRGVFCGQGEQVLDEGVAAILVEEICECRIVRALRFRRHRADRGEEIIPGKGEIV